MGLYDTEVFGIQQAKLSNIMINSIQDTLKQDTMQKLRMLEIFL